MKKLSFIGAFCCAVWLLAVAAGTLALTRYQNTPGQTTSTPLHWPPAAALALDSQHPTLLMFAHPQCPCTRASINELNRLLAQSQGRVTATVFFFKPANSPTNWANTDLWRSASAIPGLNVREDPDGKLAQFFGAETSGFVTLYDPQGELLFKGGITSGRGHAGDNPGLSATVSLLAGQSTVLRQTPVFGCSIVDQCETPAKEVKL